MLASLDVFKLLKYSAPNNPIGVKILGIHWYLPEGTVTYSEFCSCMHTDNASGVSFCSISLFLLYT